MGFSVNLDVEFVNSAKAYAALQHRSTPKQIEHWAVIGRIAEDNPDLSYEDIKGILLGMEDVKQGKIEEYRADEL